MGRMIVTKTLISKTPYIMKESGSPLYSYEELCYYIKTRMALWVEEKTREGLTEKMSEWAVPVSNLDNLSPVQAAKHILNGGTYFKAEEKEQILLMMQEYEDEEDHFVLKEKGDMYLSYGKIQKAYRLYLQASYRMNGEESAEWKASLHHNLGVVCCRFFYWKEAKNWFALAIDAKDTIESREGLELVLEMEQKGWIQDGSSVSVQRLQEKQDEFMREIR